MGYRLPHLHWTLFPFQIFQKLKSQQFLSNSQHVHFPCYLWNDSHHCIHRKKRKCVWNEGNIQLLFFLIIPMSSLQFPFTLYRSGFVFTHMGSLCQMLVLVEFVTSLVLQWWPLTFQSELLESFKISELVQPGESLRFLLWSPWEGGRICPSTAYSWPFLGSTMISFVALTQLFVCGREHISYFSRLARMCQD